VTTRRVRVVKDADTSVLVHRVETALVLHTREWPALGPQTMSNPRSAREQQRYASRRAGAQFRNDIVSGFGGKQILLDDPAGNPIELFEPPHRR
jgi:hypothetical protein